MLKSRTGTFAVHLPYRGLDLPALPAGLAWDTSRLYTDGVLSVAAAAQAVAAGHRCRAAVWCWRAGRAAAIDEDATFVVLGVGFTAATPLRRPRRPDNRWRLFRMPR